MFKPDTLNSALISLKAANVILQTQTQLPGSGSGVALISPVGPEPSRQVFEGKCEERHE